MANVEYFEFVIYSLFWTLFVTTYCNSQLQRVVLFHGIVSLLLFSNVEKYK